MILARVARATVAVVLRDPVNGFMVLLDPDLRFHAASTMKLPVLMALGRQADAGTLAWDDSVVVVNRFASIVDGSPYALDPAEDSDSTNLATNILLASVVTPESATRMIRILGADSMLVLRGVEDGKAYQKGPNNTTTARDLSTLLLAIAGGITAKPSTTRELLRVLEAQEFNEGIPAGLTGSPLRACGPCPEIVPLCEAKRAEPPLRSRSA